MSILKPSSNALHPIDDVFFFCEACIAVSDYVISYVLSSLFRKYSRLTVITRKYSSMDQTGHRIDVQPIVSLNVCGYSFINLPFKIPNRR